MQQRKQRFLLFITLVCVSMGAKAQFYIGLEAGMANNQLYTNTSNLAFTQYKKGSGMSIGIPMSYKIEEWFSIAATPSYTQKNYSVERTGYFQGIYQKSSNGYIQLPLMGQFSFGSEQIRGYVNLGIYAAYWATANIKGAQLNALNPVDTAYFNSTPTNISGEVNLYNYNEKYAFNTVKDNRLELGWLTGVGVSYETEGGYRFYLE